MTQRCTDDGAGRGAARGPREVDEPPPRDETPHADPTAIHAMTHLRVETARASPYNGHRSDVQVKPVTDAHQRSSDLASQAVILVVGVEAGQRLVRRLHQVHPLLKLLPLPQESGAQHADEEAEAARDERRQDRDRGNRPCG